MTPRSTALVSITGAMLLHGGVAGCYPPIPEPPPPPSGYTWCVYADPARGWTESGVLQNITDPVSGLWMSACTCYCPEDHAVMLGGVNGTLVPGSDADAFYAEQLALLRTAAEIACLERSIELQMELGTTLDFEFAGAVSCQAAVADEEPQFAGECPFDETQCQGGATAGLGSEGDPPPSTEGSTVGTVDGSGDAADTTAAPETTTGGSGGSGSDGGGVMIGALRGR